MIRARALPAAGRALAVAAVATALLAGCAGVPTSGPIEQGDLVAAPGGDQFIRVIARPPRAGMTPEEVVRGFQEATASQDTRFTVAKQYLTDLAATAWDPSAGVSVYDNNGLTFDRTGAAVAAEGGLSGQIDGDGQYSVAAPGTTLKVSYGMTQVDGEWRINSLPAGLVLGRGDIDRGYRAFDLFYFTRDLATLVPAPITVPLTESGLATQLVSALVGGPTPWIAPSVSTGFPAGTRLDLDAVPVVDGIADVALTKEVLAADDAERQALSAQLVWTLRQLPDISGVRITVGGQPLLVPGAGTIQSMESWPSYDPDAVPDTFTAYAISGDALARITADNRIARVTTLTPAAVLPAVSLDSTRVAAVSPNRRRLWEYPLATPTAGVARYTGTELSRPSWDRTGAAWTVDRGTGLVMVSEGEPALVPVAGLPGGVTDKDLVAASVSRDGTRMALIVQRGTRTEPMVARIVRTGDRVSVSAPQRVDSQLTDSFDLAWADAGTLVVLGTSGRSSLEVLQFAVGTTGVRRVGAPEGATSVAAGPSRALLVGTDEGLYAATAAAWTRLGSAADPVYPG